MKKVALLLVLVLLFVGCAHKKVVFTRKGAVPEEFNADNYVCVQESRTRWSANAPPPPPPTRTYGVGPTIAGGILAAAVVAANASAAQAQANKLYVMCMEARGWVRVIPEATGSLGIMPNRDGTIVRVLPNGPADKAGVKVGSQVISFNGTPWLDWEWYPLAINEEVMLVINQGGADIMLKLVTVPMSDLIK